MALPGRSINILTFSPSVPLSHPPTTLPPAHSANEIPALGTLIWISVKPLIRLIIPTGIGFILSRTGLFPAAASKGASQAILNCTLPALLFAKIIPSITQQNAPSIGSSLSFFP